MFGRRPLAIAQDLAARVRSYCGLIQYLTDGISVRATFSNETHFRLLHGVLQTVGGCFSTGNFMDNLLTFFILQCTSKVSTCPTKDLRALTTQTSLWLRSKVLLAQKTLSSTWVRESPTSTDVPRKSEVLRSELSGVRLTEHTVTPVLSELLSDLTCQLRLSVLLSESSCTHLTSKHVETV